MQRQRRHNSNSKGEGLSSSDRGGKSTSNERPRVSQPQQKQQPSVAAIKKSTSRIHRSNSCGNGRYSGDVNMPTQSHNRRRDFRSPERAAASECYVQSFRRLSTSNRKSPAAGVVDANRRFLGRFQQELPFGSQSKVDSSTATLSPRQHKKPSSDSTPRPPPSSRSSHHAGKSSRLPRRNVYSKGINVNNLYPPPPRRMLQNSHPSETSSSSPHSPSTPYEVSAVVSLHRPAHCPSIHTRSGDDAATSRLRELCMDIIQSAKEGTSPLRRAEIKEAVVEYHRSHNNAVSPRDPNFTEIPSEFSQVLTYGLARSQTVQPSPTAADVSEKQLMNTDTKQSRLRELCMDIIQSAREGTSPPQRAEIKEAVVEYHRSRNNAASPRDPNFTEIPSEFSQVLTYGLARAQTVQLSPTATEESEKLTNNDTNELPVAKGPERRSRFSE
eukprot:scaffold17569_cov159-Skeletonema_marinoi.AAC.1